MEVLLFVLFFISALIFFIAGKDDFGRNESKLTINKEEKFAKEIKKEEKVPEEIKKDEKVAEEGSIKPKDALKKES